MAKTGHTWDNGEQFLEHIVLPIVWKHKFYHICVKVYILNTFKQLGISDNILEATYRNSCVLNNDSMKD